MSIDNQPKSLSDRVFVIFTGKAGAYSSVDSTLRKTRSGDELEKHSSLI